MESSLSSLVRSEAVIAEELMAETLRPLFSFTDAGGVVPSPAFHSLSPRKKVLSLLMAVKALNMLGFRQVDDAGPTEISNLGGIPLGTVKPELRELEKQKLSVSQKGRYQIPLSSLSRVAALIGEQEKNGS